MGISQIQNAEEEPPNDPFIPPKGDVCFIHDLPPELLSRVFELGCASDGTWDDDKAVDATDFLRHIDANRADESNVHDGDVEVKEEHEGDEKGEEECTHDGCDSDATGSSGSRLPFQILVSYVCRHWCDVAFSTPSLWTTIGVTPRAGLSSKPGLLLMERSKDLPVDICMNCQLYDYEDDATEPSDEDLRSLFSVFVPHVHRWRTMTIGVPEYHLMYEFLRAVSDPSTSAASQLTTLELYYNKAADESDSFRYPSMSKHLVLFGGSAPLLTTLALWGVHVDWDQPWIASASNLKDLELGFHAEDVRPSWAQFATILRGAPALEKLSLHHSGPAGHPAEWFIEPTPASPAGPIQLARLTDFNLLNCSPTRAIGLLRRLHLPALTSLVLRFNDGDCTDLVYELAGPATSPASLRSPREQQQPRQSLLSQLDRLKIIGLPCHPEGIETLYGELQNLTSLNVALWSLPPTFLDVLGARCTLAGRGDVWLPRLATLCVSGTSGRALRRVVRRRRDAGVPLGALYVEKSCAVDGEDVVWLMENVERLRFFEGDID